MFDDHVLELQIYAVFSSGNHDGDAEGNIDEKMILCFTCESRSDEELTLETSAL